MSGVESGVREESIDLPENSAEFRGTLRSDVHTLGIAFEGCACKSAFQAGAAEWLLDRGLRFSVVAGASSGSVNAAAIATAQFSGVTDAWRRLGGQKVFVPSRAFRGHWPFRMSEIVGDVVQAHIGNVRLDDAEIEIAIPITHLGPSGATRRILTRRDSLPVVEAVLASCFIPGPYSRILTVNRRPAFDGAWQIRTPVEEVFAHGAKRAIACVSDDRGRLLAGFPRVRILDVPEACRVLAPCRKLPIGSFDFARTAIEESIAIGRESAAVFAREHEEWLCGV